MGKDTVYYKWLREDGTSPYQGHKWPLPQGKRPGKWVQSSGTIALCKNGVHGCTQSQLIHHISSRLFVMEVKGDVIFGDDKFVSEFGRLVQEVATINDRTLRLFACDCAARTLKIFERKCPDDKRPRKAIRIAREFVNGTATKEEMAAASAAARGAARYIAIDAAMAAAKAAAWAAARYIATDAAIDAAMAVAWANSETARVAERCWQNKRLLEYVNGKRRAPEAGRDA